MDVNIALKKYIKSQRNAQEKNTVENFIRQNRIGKNALNKKAKSKNVNFIDEIDKTKNLAEVIYIKSYKESNTLEHEEDDKDDNVISTQDKNETIITNCTCNIF